MSERRLKECQDFYKVHGVLPMPKTSRLLYCFFYRIACYSKSPHVPTVLWLYDVGWHRFSPASKVIITKHRQHRQNGLDVLIKAVDYQDAQTDQNDQSEKIVIDDIVFVSSEKSEKKLVFTHTLSYEGILSQGAIDQLRIEGERFYRILFDEVVGVQKT